MNNEQIEDKEKSLFLENNKHTSNDNISLCMVGDLLIHNPIFDYAYNINTDSYNFDFIFENIEKYIKQYDIKIINDEVLIAGKKYNISGFPRFNSPFELADSIIKAGFNIILKANNHANDLLEEGLSEDLNNWKKYKNAIIIGSYLNEEEYDTIKYFIKNNIKIALLNYCYGSNRRLRNKYLMNKIEYNKIERDIEKAKSEGAEFIIVFPHWGKEYKLIENEYQNYWSNIFFDLGVDLVIGTHPHVIQPIKIIENDKRKMYIFNSLGNFINATSKRKKKVFLRFLGGMAHVIIGRNDDKKVVIKDIKFIPLITHIYEKDKKITTFKVKDYSKQMAEENYVGFEYDKTFSYDNMMKVFKEVIDNKFLDFNL